MGGGGYVVVEVAVLRHSQRATGRTGRDVVRAREVQGKSEQLRVAAGLRM